VLGPLGETRSERHHYSCRKNPWKNGVLQASRSATRPRSLGALATRFGAATYARLANSAETRRVLA
jgi:hypothetical protein